MTDLAHSNYYLSDQRPCHDPPVTTKGPLPQPLTALTACHSFPLLPSLHYQIQEASCENAHLSTISFDEDWSDPSVEKK